MFRWLEDQVLAWLQRRCKHPGLMVAADILEGGAPTALVRLRYCRRCGAYAIEWNPVRVPMQNPGRWHTPDPNLWRGK